MAIQWNERRGASPLCEFHYPPYAWRDLIPVILFGTDEQVRELTAQLEDRDRALEDHLANRPCCECREIAEG